MNTINATCSYCKIDYLIEKTKADRARRLGRRLYCSRKCHHDFKKNDWNKIAKNCTYCGKEYKIKLGMYNHQLRKDPDKVHWFCSDSCCRSYKTENKVFTKLVDCNCDWCKKPFQIMQQHLKNKKHFCTRECQGKYASYTFNLGSGRSQLELLIEQQIRKEYPELFFITNNRDICKPVELDFYFPHINKAIEINGPCHHKIVYSEKALNQTRRNDSYKKILCKEKNIDLLVVEEYLDHKKDNSLEIYNKYVKPFLSNA